MSTLVIGRTYGSTVDKLKELGIEDAECVESKNKELLSDLTFTDDYESRFLPFDVHRTVVSNKKLHHSYAAMAKHMPNMYVVCRHAIYTHDNLVTPKSLPLFMSKTYIEGIDGKWYEDALPQMDQKFNDYLRQDKINALNFSISPLPLINDNRMYEAFSTYPADPMQLIKVSDFIGRYELHKVVDDHRVSLSCLDVAVNTDGHFVIQMDDKCYDDVLNVTFVDDTWTLDLYSHDRGIEIIETTNNIDEADSLIKSFILPMEA